MVIIKLYDYWDEWYGWCGIGIGSNSADAVGKLIDSAIAKGEDIEVHINSGGGFVYDGFNIYNALLEAKKKVNVDTFNMGIAASIASVIMMAGTHRKVAKASLTMIHKPSIDLWYCGSLDATQLQREADALNKIQEVLVSIYQEATSLEADAIDSMINSTTWLSPLDCETLGFATEIISAGASDKADVPDAVINNINKTAPANIGILAGKFFNSIQTKNINTGMSKESEAALKANTSVMKKMVNAITKAFGKAKNESLVLEDGTEVFFDGTLEVGTEVFSDSEMLTPVEDGTYTLTDQSTFVTVDGAVTEINAAEAVTEDAPEDTVESLSARIAVLESENKALKVKNSTLTADVKEVTKALVASNDAMDKMSGLTSTYKPAAKREISSKERSNSNGGEKKNFSLPAKNTTKK